MKVRAILWGGARAQFLEMPPEDLRGTGWWGRWLAGQGATRRGVRRDNHVVVLPPRAMLGPHARRRVPVYVELGAVVVRKLCGGVNLEVDGNSERLTYHLQVPASTLVEREMQHTRAPARWIKLRPRPTFNIRFLSAPLPADSVP